MNLVFISEPNVVGTKKMFIGPCTAISNKSDCRSRALVEIHHEIISDDHFPHLADPRRVVISYK